MKFDINIKEIESKREGLEEVLIFILNKYEQESGMIVERIHLDEDRKLTIYDRLNI